MRLTILLSALVTTMLLSCKAGQNLAAPAVAMTDSAVVPLTGHKWYLVKIHTNPEIQPVEKRAFINFDTVKGSAGGKGSCNSFGSTLTVDGDKMTIENIFSTKMYCEGVYETEKAFFEQLGKVTRFEIKGDKLFLFGSAELLLELKNE